MSNGETETETEYCIKKMIYIICKDAGIHINPNDYDKMLDLSVILKELHKKGLITEKEFNDTIPSI